MARKGENIRKRKDGRWEGRYTERMSGTAKVHSVYAKTYRDVKRKLLEAKAGVMQDAVGRFVYQKEFQKDMPISRIAEEWLAEIKRVRKYATFIKYRNIYEKYIREPFGNLTSQTISPDVVKNQIVFGKSLSIRKSIYCVLNQIFSYGAQHDFMPDIHIKGGLPRNRTSSIAVLDLSEQTKLVNYLYNDMDIYKLGILLCLSTGLRLGEVCALQWSDFDMNLKMLHINRTVQRISVEQEKTKTRLIEGKPKTESSRREIPIPDQLYPLLVSHHKPSGYLFRSSAPLDPRTYQNKFKSYLQAAGIAETHFHVLRHTFATNCIENGADVKSVSELLGHTDVKITLNRYVHPSTATKRSHINSLWAIRGQNMGQVS